MRSFQRRFGAFAVIAAVVATTAGVSSATGKYPLEPVDTSSPRATLEGFLATARSSVKAFTTDHDLLDREQSAFWKSVDRGTQFLDLRDIPPAEQQKLGDDAYFHLWEVLTRIQLPAAKDIPNAAALSGGETEVTRWRIPHTPIAIARVEKGERRGEFLFTKATVADVKQLYQQVRNLPVITDLGLENPHRVHLEATGWMFPHSWTTAMPRWLATTWFDQVSWKWIALVTLLTLMTGAVILVHRRFATPDAGHSLRIYERRMATPLATLLLMWALSYLAERQIGVTGGGEHATQIVILVAVYLALAWLIALLALAIGEAIISSPKIKDRSLDAHLVRLSARVIAIIAGCAVLFEGGTQIGLPIYGLLAGLGVGGLAIALATQTTLENFMGSLNLYLDRPVRVGDFCGYDGKMGTVEDIGLRSTRIRGLDDTITTIPNGDFSKVRIVNYTRRERVLFNSFLRLRLDTTEAQLRFILAKLRELLLAHPSFADHEEEAMVRVASFSETSIDVEIFAYAKTDSWFDFLPMREDILLRMKALIEEAGTSLAVPATTVGTAAESTDEERRRAAEEAVDRWRAEGSLPFPFFGEERALEIAGTLDYPPEGSRKKE